MVDSHAIPELDAHGLRQFALVTSGIVAVLFGLALPLLFGFRSPLWPWLLCGVLVLWGWLAPASLRPVYVGWMRFGLFMNRIVTPVVLGFVFFCVITPVALFMKMIRRDPMARSLDENTDSYRVRSTRSPREKMERPY
jgi:hypothetical protein